MKRFAIFMAFAVYSVMTFAQLNIVELGRYPYSTSLSDIWGYVDKTGNEYALVGAYDGFSVVDVTDPSSLTEVYFEDGVESIWRDIKTWNNHAYVSTEGGNGILIVDLSPLPGSITSSTYYTGSTYPFSTVHNIYVDEFGKLYIFGADNGNGGAIICDLTADPMNPVELGRFNDHYLHDGMARGDTLWGGAIYAGMMLAIDVSDPEMPNIMGSVSTPNQFTHNAWVSDDGQHVFTTDEIGGAFIAAYNVTNMNNIYETDRIQSSPGSNVIPHNAHVNNDYIVTSYYADGVTIHDANRPNNLIEVGFYDTSPDFSGDGYNGCWGVYPFLPSGNLVASDMQKGLYVLEPEYTRGCYVEGVVRDSATGAPLSWVTIKIVDTDVTTVTNLSGDYAFGTPISGTYDIEFAHPEYPGTIIEDIELVNGVLTELDVEMSSWYTDIDETAENTKINTYPNPFSSLISVEYQLDKPVTSNSSLQIFDINGRIVEMLPLVDQQATVVVGDDLPSGIYLVKIMNGSEVTKTKRVSKL